MTIRIPTVRPAWPAAPHAPEIRNVIRRAAWHRLDRFLARLRPLREPLPLLIDGAVLALAWNVTYLFRLGFERWIWRVM